jgi:hypothetical protein
MGSKMNMYRTFAIVTATLVLGPIAVAEAHNPCCTVKSPGVPGAAISLDGVSQPGEWTGGTSISVGGGNPLNGTLTVLHKADGIYILAVINDSSKNDNDAFNLRFDINHNGGATTDMDDFGVRILRNGQALWGPASTVPDNWSPVPADLVGVTPGATFWTVEFHLPTGAPSNLSLSTGTIGTYFSLYNRDDVFGPNSAKYAQWPPAPLADPNALLDGNPDQWANYVFNPETTFPNVAVTDVRRDNAGQSNHNTIAYTGINSFAAQLRNPGGTAIPDATNVRVNLYLGARGIGESWHRMDTNTVLRADCSAPDAAWNSQVLAKSDVCNGPLPLPDISTMTINNVVGNTAKYTIQNGLVMNRTGGDNITVPSATQNYFPVIDWNVTPQQGSFFVPVTVNGMSFDRAHQSMLAEIIVPSDPNLGSNLVQVNMNFAIVVPDFVGRGFDEANTLAENAGIILEHRFPPLLFDLRVKSQNFPPGDQIPPTVHVILTFENASMPPP